VFAYEVTCDACNSTFYYKEANWGARTNDNTFTRKTPPGDGSTIVNFNETTKQSESNSIQSTIEVDYTSENKTHGLGMRDRENQQVDWHCKIACPRCNHEFTEEIQSFQIKILLKYENKLDTFAIPCKNCGSTFYLKDELWGSDNKSWIRTAPTSKSRVMN
jgi:predicted nucleic-acid-binding Zn-ribbon protein